MIELNNIDESAKGMWVTFRYQHGDLVCGRLLRWTEARAYVVFNCDDNWNQFDRYTAQGCDPQFLEWSINQVTDLYTDGGVILRNPSEIGGTWAWVGVNSDDKKVMEWSGAIPNPKTLKITNNHMEQIAVTLALEAMPEKWSGKVHSDSSIALGRVFKNFATENLPSNVIRRTEAAKKRLGRVGYRHLKGHPTELELAMGIAENGMPVSRHNVRADKLCGLEAMRYLQAISFERKQEVEYASTS